MGTTTSTILCLSTLTLAAVWWEDRVAREMLSALARMAAVLESLVRLLSVDLMEGFLDMMILIGLKKEWDELTSASH